MSNPVMISYSAVRPQVEVKLSATILTTLSEEARKAGRDETGGILIGFYEGEFTAVVDEIAPMPKDSSFGRSWFRRGRHGLEELLQNRWQKGLHYLGEWHSHPGGDPAPSGPDSTAMHRIAVDPLYRCPAPLLLIVGERAPGFSISINVFIRGEMVRLRYGFPPMAMSRSGSTPYRPI